MMLHTKYQCPVVSDKKSFSCFPYISLCKKKYMTPGWDHFWPQGQKLNKLGRDPLSDATYQTILYKGFRPSGFRQEDFFTFSVYKPI